jgi:hypothetical protein
MSSNNPSPRAPPPSTSKVAKGVDLRAQASRRKSLAVDASAAPPAERPSTALTAAQRRQRLERDSHMQKPFFSCCSGGDVEEGETTHEDVPLDGVGAPASPGPTGGRGRSVEKPKPLEQLQGDNAAAEEEWGRPSNQARRMSASDSSPNQRVDNGTTAYNNKDVSTLARVPSVHGKPPQTPLSARKQSTLAGSLKDSHRAEPNIDEPPKPVRRLQSKASLQLQMSSSAEGGIRRAPSFSSGGSPATSPGAASGVLPGSVEAAPLNRSTDERPGTSSTTRRQSSFVMPSATTGNAGKPQTPSSVARPPLARAMSGSGELQKSGNKRSSIVTGAAGVSPLRDPLSAADDLERSPMGRSGNANGLPPMGGKGAALRL